MQKQWFRRGFLTRMFAHEAQCSPGESLPSMEGFAGVESAGMPHIT